MSAAKEKQTKLLNAYKRRRTFAEINRDILDLIEARTNNASMQQYSYNTENNNENDNNECCDRISTQKRPPPDQAEAEVDQLWSSNYVMFVFVHLNISYLPTMMLVNKHVRKEAWANRFLFHAERKQDFTRMLKKAAKLNCSFFLGEIRAMCKSKLRGRKYCLREAEQFPIIESFVLHDNVAALKQMRSFSFFDKAHLQSAFSVAMKHERYACLDYLLSSVELKVKDFATALRRNQFVLARKLMRHLEHKEAGCWPPTARELHNVLFSHLQLMNK